MTFHLILIGLTRLKQMQIPFSLSYWCGEENTEPLWLACGVVMGGRRAC